MKTKCLLILLVGMFYADRLSAQQNVIVNGDVEEWEASYVRPTGFSLNTQLRNVGYCTKSSAGEGYGDTGYCVRFKTQGVKTTQGGNLTSGSAYIQTPNVAFPESDIDKEGCYEFSFFIKGHARINSIGYGSPVTHTTPFQIYSKSDDWVKYSGSQTITPTSGMTAYLRYYVYDVRSPYLYADNFSFTRVPDNVATIRSIGYASPVQGNNFGSFLPNFDPDVFDYTVDIWFGADTLPALLIDPMNKLASVTTNYDEIKTFSSEETTKELVITVVSKDGSDTKRYTITFDRSNYVIGGLSSDIFTNSLREGIAISSNLDVHIMDNGRSLLGAYSIKPLSPEGEETYLITRTLKNGARNISFSTGLYATNANATLLSDAIASGAELAIAVSVSDDGSDNFVFVDEHIIDLTKSEWQEVSFDINSDSPDTKVKIEYVKNSGDKTLPFLLDDIVISPYVTSNIETPEWSDELPKWKVYAKAGGIVIEEQAPYWVYSVGGQLLDSGVNRSDKVVVPVQQGLYIVKVWNRTKKIIVSE